MRLGGPDLGKFGNPEEWVRKLAGKGYRSAFCPVGTDADQTAIRKYEEAARKADVVIAEVGVWNNPIDPDGPRRKEAMEACRRSLALADEIGARCCVNCAGTLHPDHWFGPHPDNFKKRGMDLIVQSIRDIIDSVRPRRTFYTIETMGFIPPDSVECYEEIFKAVDRDRFAVHFDPVNLINTPRRYFDTGAVITEFIRRLGRHIKSCHAKDILLTTELTVHLAEIPPGQGALDYAVLLRELDALDADMPLLLEHLKSDEEYPAAAAYVRKVSAGLK